MTDKQAGDENAARLNDPFSVFLVAHATGKGLTVDKRFNGGEHAWLGSAGAALACQRLRDQVSIDPGLFDAIARRDDRESLQYGELVALSGDFYGSPDELFEEQKSLVPWLWESNDLTDLRKSFARELEWINHRLDGAEDDKPYPDENIRLAWNAKSYVELALNNNDHFGWHNQLAYARHHQSALELARSARGPGDERLRRAIYTNAFADHFLTDGFAAGHIRVPRAEIRGWAAGNGLSERVAGLLSKLLHDQDGHANLACLHGECEPLRVVGGSRQRAALGLPVVNALDQRWSTFCDGQLFLGKSVNDPAIRHAVEAVADSVEELVLAWKHQSMPDGPYRATSRVPFPDREAPTLAQKFPYDMSAEDLERLWRGMSWYVKVPWLSGLNRDHLRSLLAALPALMAAFRENVVRTTRTQSPDVARLDPRYVTAFTRIA
jgi:hypothetical protein